MLLLLATLAPRVGAAQSAEGADGSRPPSRGLEQRFDERDPPPRTPMPRRPAIIRDFDTGELEGGSGATRPARTVVPRLPDIVRDFDGREGPPRPEGPRITRDYLGREVETPGDGAPQRRLQTIHDYDEQSGRISIVREWGEGDVWLPRMVFLGGGDGRASGGAERAQRDESRPREGSAQREAGAGVERDRAEVAVEQPAPRRRRARRRARRPFQMRVFLGLMVHERVVPLTAAVSSGAPLVGHPPPLAHGALAEVGLRLTRLDSGSLFAGASALPLPGSTTLAMVRGGVAYRRATSTARVRAWLLGTVGVAGVVPSGAVWFEPSVGVGVGARVARAWELFAEADVGIALGSDRAIVRNDSGLTSSYHFSVVRVGLSAGVRVLP